MNWAAVAVDLAETHYLENFDKPWLVGSRDTEGKVYVWSNCPRLVNVAPRNAAMREIAEVAAKIGFVQIGYGEYAQPDPSRGPACAAILGYPDNRLAGLEWKKLRPAVDQLMDTKEVIAWNAFP